MYGISQMFSIILLTKRGILDSVICTAHFSKSFNSEFSERNKKRFRVCSV